MAKAAGNSYSSSLSSPRRCSTLHILALRGAKQIGTCSSYRPILTSRTMILADARSNALVAGESPALRNGPTVVVSASVFQWTRT